MRTLPGTFQGHRFRDTSHKKTLDLRQPNDMVETRLSLLYRLRDLNDGESWQEFHELYYPLLINFVKAKGLDRDNAEDVVQELLISLARRLPQLDFDKQRGRFRTYLWQAAHNGVATWFRKNAKHNKAGAQDMESRIAELEYESQTDPDQEFVTALRKRVLERSLVRIKSTSNLDTWQCFQMHVLERTPAKEVAERLNRSENSVFVNAARVMQRLRELCNDYMEELNDE